MDMQKILEYRNARNRFCQRVGITVTELSPGYAKVVKTVTEDDLNPVDVAHGGLFFSMADNAAGSAMAAYGEQAVTLNAQYNFMLSFRLTLRLNTGWPALVSLLSRQK